MTHRTLFTFTVRADRLAEYEREHAAVWPDMLAALRDTGWRNYSIFSKGNGEIIGYFESEDPAAAQAAMADLDVNSRWQQAMAQYFETAGPAESMTTVPQIFHLESQLDSLTEGATHANI